MLDAGELLKGDAVSRFNAYAVALQNNIMSIDEVRYRENLAPLDFNYMKLSLADVLYNPISGEIITPNTGLTQDAKSGLTAPPHGCIIEEETSKKDNWVKGDKGLFAGSVPTFGGGKMRITKSEYTRLCHQIATDYPLLPADGRTHFYENRNCIYQFTVLNFGSYSFSFKAPIEGNEEKIAVLRRSTHE